MGTNNHEWGNEMLEGSGRIAALLSAAEHWKRQLVDTSRSPLLNYRDLKTGTLELTPGSDRGVNGRLVDSLLAGRQVRLSNLFPSDLISGEENRADARRRLKRICQVEQAYLEEKGTNTLFLAIGLATWEVTSGARPNSPIILLPLSASAEDAAHREFRLQLEGDAHFNPILAHAVQTQYGIELSEDAFDLEEPPKDYASFLRLLEEFSESLTQVEGLAINPRLVVSNFRYNNMPMVSDLDQNLETFANNDLVAAIAGVPDARRALESQVSDPSPSQPDKEPPSAEYLVMDADASQHQAINRALAGQSVVVWGPPGTGKSQTIANLIAALIANSKKVLFVAQKQAAVEVVISRLHKVGLSDLIMDCHGGFRSRREFSRGLADAMQRISSTPAKDYSLLQQDLFDVKHELIAHDEVMHQQRVPWNVSAFEVQTQLLGIPEPARTDLRLSREKVHALNQTALREIQRDVEQWISWEGPFLTERYPWWAQAGLNAPEDVRQALDVLYLLQRERLPQTSAALANIAHRMGLRLPTVVAQWPDLTYLLVNIDRLMGNFRQDIYKLDHTSLLEELTPRRSRLARFAVSLSGRNRAARLAVQEVMTTPGKLTGDDACRAIAEANWQLQHWKQYCQNGTISPATTGDVAQLHSMASDLISDLTELANAINRPDLLQIELEDLLAKLSEMASQQQVATLLPQLRELENRFQAAGIKTIVSAAGTQFPLELGAQAVAHSWLQGVWSELTLEEPRLSGFVGEVHNRARDKFATLDSRHLKENPERIKRVAAEQAIGAMNEHREQTELVRREAAKRSRHMSVRQLLHQAPEVLSALRPCWMMSPLQVAEMIPASASLFDVVIFDEASQIPPAEAIGTLARAGQAIVAGDDRQLPPTNFFRSQDDDDAEEQDDALQDLAPALVTDIESILDVVKALPIREQMLQWHYRSRDGRLIAFSNAHIYGESLTAFPGTAPETPLTLHKLDLSPPLGRSTRSHPEEVEKVVDLILEHALQRPEESLGVIAFGSHHADNIEEGLRRRLSGLNDTMLDTFFAADKDEKFFVKNIERVQGDERDIIILSVGYHKAANGTLPYRFGPLNQEGGERRLNVAVTRARSRIHLVAGFSHHDMEPGRSTAKGVELLRQYLEFATTGGNELGGTLSNEPLNPFELDILHQLEKRGIPVTPQYGVSGYRLDFACAHPNQPGRMLLAIEADGATYHSTPTARDRDRLRQEVLENLGWLFHRIWSTDWFRDPEKEADRVLEAWRRAVELADRQDNGLVVRSDGPPAHAPAGPVARPVSPARGPRPSVRPGLPITEYRQAELMALTQWIMSDTLLRTDEELQSELRRELGFRRRGSRIDAILRQVIDAVRRTGLS